MTTKDFITKWLAYGLALLPVWFLQAFVLSRFPLFGVKPMLLPLAAVSVAVLEGASGGAGFGLAVGVLMDAVIPGMTGVRTILMTLIGLGTGLASRYVLSQSMTGCFLCSAAALAVLDALRILLWLVTGKAGAGAMVVLAGKEIAWSVCFVPAVYLLFSWVFDRVPKPTVL